MLAAALAVECRPTRLQVRTELYTAANVGALNRIRAQLQSVRRPVPVPCFPVIMEPN